MKKIKAFLSVLLTAALIFAAVPIAASAEDNALEVKTVLTGNTGAVISANENVSAYTDEAELVRLFVVGDTVTVKARDGAVGIATVRISDEDEDVFVKVPVGYTTFEFNGDTLTVYGGSDANYEILGINSAAEEYVPESVLDGNGNNTYSSTDTYKIDVEIKKKGGTYVFYGESDDMTIAVKKEATAEANLLFAGLVLSSFFTSPLTIKKNSTSVVNLNVLEGYENTLSDAEFNDADLYGDTAEGGDGTNVTYAESAVIKGKAYANLTVCGGGVLNLNCATKNAIKIGEYGSLTVEEATLNIVSAKHGISADNTITVNSGKINVSCTGDGIRTDPDAVDSTAGTSGIITINGGSLTIKSGNDAIQTAQDITITGGEFDITAGEGYNDSSFDPDTMSCKGIKASFSADTTTDTSTDTTTDTTTDTSEATNAIVISGGTFNLNCADDAVHSDAYIDITGGTFNIKTGDDGVHADTTLNIGTDGGDNCDLIIDVTTSYEGLEAGTVNIYSGLISVVASDDGINAAGGSDTSDQPGQGFNPGGGNRPGFGGNTPGGSTSTTTSDYNINIYGGDVFVNVDGDGLDSNGGLTLSGGYIVVWGQKSGGDNEPLDSDGALTINGATVFAAGSSMMTTTPQNSQGYVTSKTSISSGKTVNVVYNSSTVFNTVAIKDINYVLYSSPDMSSSSGWSISSSSDSVTEPTVTAVEIYTMPSKTEYLTGNSLDTSGLELKVTYSDGRTARISDGFTVSGFDMNTVGTQSVTVTYGSASTSFDITVAQNTRIIAKSFEPNTESTTVFSVIDGMNYIYGLTPYLTQSDFETDDVVMTNVELEIELSDEYMGTGTIVYAKSVFDGSIIGTYEVVVFGDINGDAIYDGEDAVIADLLAGEMLAKGQVGEAAILAADCNHDGVTDQADVELLNQAGAILAKVDQTKTQEELQTDSLYAEYLNLIDQQGEITENPSEAEPYEATEPSLIERLLSFVRRIVKIIIDLL